MNNFERAKKLIARALEEALQRYDIDTLVAYSGIDKKMIQKYLDGEGNPTLKTLSNLVETIHVTLALVFLDNEDITSDKKSQVADAIQDAKQSMRVSKDLMEDAERALDKALDDLIK